MSILAFGALGLIGLTGALAGAFASHTSGPYVFRPIGAMGFGYGQPYPYPMMGAPMMGSVSMMGAPMMVSGMGTSLGYYQAQMSCSQSATQWYQPPSMFRYY